MGEGGNDELHEADKGMGRWWIHRIGKAASPRYKEEET